MEELICGIDPGKTGAISFLKKNGEIHSYHVMPYKEMVDSRALEKILNPLSFKIQHVFLEHAQSLPLQGVKPMFNYGVTFGKILATIELLSLPHTLIKAVHWQSVMFIGVNKDLPPKQKAAIIATRLWPSEIEKFPILNKKPHDGIIDSMLICEYGRRTFCG